MGDKEEGGLLGGFLGKAEKWLEDQGVSHDDLEKYKRDSERSEAEATAQKEAGAKEDRQARAGSSHVTLSGVVTGSVNAGMAVQTEREDGALSVTVECVDPVPLQGGRSFAGLSFVIPDYKGAGTYDLGKMDTSGQTYELMLDPVDEGFFWTDEYGPGVVKVAAGESAADVHFVYRNPGSNQVELEGVIEL
jgi:hypothetical protein